MNSKDAYNNHIIEMFKMVSDNIRLYGHDGFMRKMQAMLNDPNDTTNEFVMHYILNQVADVYGVTVKDITDSRKRGSVDDARCLCYALFPRHILIENKPISQRRIASFFKCNVGKVNTVITYVQNQLSSNKKKGNPVLKKFEPDFMVKYKVLDKKIQLYKKQLKSNNNGNNENPEGHTEEKN